MGGGHELRVALSERALRLARLDAIVAADPPLSEVAGARTFLQRRSIAPLATENSLGSHK